MERRAAHHPRKWENSHLDKVNYIQPGPIDLKLYDYYIFFNNFSLNFQEFSLQSVIVSCPMFLSAAWSEMQ